jgi:hypothetical protein
VTAPSTTEWPCCGYLGMPTPHTHGAPRRVVCPHCQRGWLTWRGTCGPECREITSEVQR